MNPHTFHEKNPYQCKIRYSLVATVEVFKTFDSFSFCGPPALLTAGD